jgi:hypothetical protein
LETSKILRLMSSHAVHLNQTGEVEHADFRVEKIADTGDQFTAAPHDDGAGGRARSRS